MTADADLETDAPADAPTCAYCGRPFADADLVALHRGLAHPEAITDEERAAYEAAREDETATLREFRLKAVGALVVLYFGFLIVYALV